MGCLSCTSADTSTSTAGTWVNDDNVASVEGVGSYCVLSGPTVLCDTPPGNAKSNAEGTPHVGIAMVLKNTGELPNEVMVVVDVVV